MLYVEDPGDILTFILKKIFRLKFASIELTDELREKSKDKLLLLG